MGKQKTSLAGDIEMEIKTPAGRKLTKRDYQKINRALRANGIGIPKDDLKAGIHQTKLILYGDLYYDSEKDKKVKTGDPFIDSIVNKVRKEVKKQL